MNNLGIQRTDALYKYCKIVQNKKIKLLIVAGVVIIITGFFIGNALAQGDSSFGGRPAYPRNDNPRTESIFIHTLEPGDIQEEGLLVVNNSGEQKTILVYGTDSTPSTGGAFACEQAGQKKDDVGAWISLEKSEVTLASGKNIIVPFTISVPESADVGEHNGCVILQEKKTKTGDETGISLSFRTGIRTVITIPGELIRKLEIIGLTLAKKQNGNFTISPEVRNTGNVSIDSDISVITKYFFGLIHSRDSGEFPVLRGETSSWNFELPKPFWGGWYKTNFTVEYDSNSEAGVGIKSGEELTLLTSEPVWFFSVPTLGGLAIELLVLLFIVFAILLLWISRKRKKWVETSWTIYEIKQGDDINSLASRFNVSWKLIVKVNKLQAPYVLNPGQKIKLPPTT